MGDYHQITLTEWGEMKDRLRRELNDLRTSFVRVGFILRKMEDSKAYEAEGYKSVAEFALKEHGLKPSTTSRWMAINREYSIDGYSEQLDPRYLNMNASQLTEMLTLEQKDRELITPETPRADIRELKRFNADAEKAEETTAQPEKTPVQMALIAFLESDPGARAAVRNCIENGLTDPEHISEAVAPSGSRMYRAGVVFLAFSSSEIKAKTFGGGQSTVTYSEFAEVAAAWLADHPEGPEKTKEEPPHEELTAALAEPEPEEEPPHEEPTAALAEPEPEEEPPHEEPAAVAAEPEPEKPAKKELVKRERKPEKPAPAVDMNPPEPVAPAQKSEEVIVDEAGNPAPEDPEEVERKRLEEVEIHRNDVEMLKVTLNSEINYMDWPGARETAEKLLASLAFLQENDFEAIDALVRRTLHGGE